jgi:hypothetical protein
LRSLHSVHCIVTISRISNSSGQWTVNSDQFFSAGFGRSRWLRRFLN